MLRKAKYMKTDMGIAWYKGSRDHLQNAYITVTKFTIHKTKRVFNFKCRTCCSSQLPTTVYIAVF